MHTSCSLRFIYSLIHLFACIYITTFIYLFVYSPFAFALLFLRHLGLFSSSVRYHGRLDSINHGTRGNPGEGGAMKIDGIQSVWPSGLNPPTLLTERVCLSFMA